MIAQIPVDAILTDINMPDMTGLELIRRARKELPRVKAVIISGYSEFEYAREAIELKVENYILKPLDPQKITETFKKIREGLDEESYTERQNQFIQSEYEMRKGGSPENKGCEDEKQAELIRILEEGKYKEMETFVERWFVSFQGENGMEIRITATGRFAMQPSIFTLRRLRCLKSTAFRWRRARIRKDCSRYSRRTCSF